MASHLTGTAPAEDEQGAPLPLVAVFTEETNVLLSIQCHVFHIFGLPVGDFAVSNSP